MVDDCCYPIRIGVTRVPAPALVVLYTETDSDDDQNLRKRIMPLRSLGSLGREACTRKLKPYWTWCALAISTRCKSTRGPRRAWVTTSG